MYKITFQKTFQVKDKNNSRIQANIFCKNDYSLYRFRKHNK